MARMSLRGNNEFRPVAEVGRIHVSDGGRYGATARWFVFTNAEQCPRKSSTNGGSAVGGRARYTEVLRFEVHHR